MNETTNASARADGAARVHLEALQRELDKLEAMSVNQLIAKHQHIFDRSITTRNRAHLIRKIGYRLQEIAEGGLSERAKGRIAEKTGKVPIRHAMSSEAARQYDAKQLQVGAVLRRLYEGREHVVVVRDAHFEYKGRPYKSLSAIAKEITGTHWNGKVFFNLKSKKERDSK